MQFPIVLASLFAATSLAFPSSLTAREEADTVFARAVNSGRPVATGACCIANTSKKGDTCTLASGVSGICAVANTAGCGARLTCT